MAPGSAAAAQDGIAYVLPQEQQAVARIAVSGLGRHQAQQQVDRAFGRKGLFRVRGLGLCVEPVPGAQENGLDHRLPGAVALDQRRWRETAGRGGTGEGEPVGPALHERLEKGVEHLLVGDCLGSCHIGI